VKALRKLFARLFGWRNRSRQSRVLEQDISVASTQDPSLEQVDVLKALSDSELKNNEAILKSDNSSTSLDSVTDLAVLKAEQSFDVVSAQVTKLATVGQGLAKHSRRLAMFSGVSALWLWFFSFRGIIANWSWLTNISLVLLLLLLVPSVLVLCLHFVLRQSINLPKSFIELKNDILNSDDGALGLFAQKSAKHSLLASWKVFGVIRNFRDLLQTFPSLFSQYKSVLTLSNPLVATLLGGSVVACVFINLLALFTFIIWLMGRF